VSKAVEDVSIRVYLYFTLKVWAKTDDPMAEQLYDIVRQKVLTTVATQVSAAAAQELLDLQTFVSLFESYPSTSKNGPLLCLTVSN